MQENRQFSLKLKKNFEKGQFVSVTSEKGSFLRKNPTHEKDPKFVEKTLIFVVKKKNVLTSIQKKRENYGRWRDSTAPPPASKPR